MKKINQPEELHFFSVKGINFCFSPTKLILLKIPTKYEKQDVAYMVYKLLPKYNNSENINFTPREKKYSYLALFLTFECNLNCCYCFVQNYSKHQEVKTHTMSTRILSDSIDFFFNKLPTGEKIYIIYFGGEPLLRFDLIQKATEHAKNIATKQGKKVFFGISTNGTLLSSKIVNYLVKNKFNILISVDGPEHIHDQYRIYKGGKGSYSKVISGIKNLGNYNVFLRATVPNLNFSIREIASHLLNLSDTARIHIEPLLQGYSEINITCDFSVSSLYLKGISELFDVIIEDIEKTKKIRYTAILEIFKSLLTKKPRLYSCGFGQGIIAVGPDGNIYGCETAVGNPKAKMGNIYAGLSQSDTHSLRILPVDELEECKDCWARYLCGGGCMIAKIEVGCEEYHKWHCDLIRRNIEHTFYMFDFIKKKHPDILNEIIRKYRLIPNSEYEALI